jgi:hypothetical protein
MPRSYLESLEDLPGLAKELEAMKLDLPDASEPGPVQQAAQQVPSPTLPVAAPAPWKPRGYGAGLDDVALQLAQGKARNASRQSNMGRAGSELAAALGGYQADTSFWDKKEAQGKQGVVDLMQRRQASDQDISHQQSADKLQSEQDSTDPNSLGSQTARELVKGALPGVANALGPKFETMSQAQIAQNFPFMKEMLDTAAKKKARETSATELQAMKREAGRLYPNVDFSQFETPESLREFMKAAGMTSHEQGLTTRAGQMHDDRSASLSQKRDHDALMSEQRAAALDVRRGSQNFKQSQAQVNGWEKVDPSVPELTQKQKEEASDQVTAVHSVKNLLKEMREIIDRNDGRILNKASDDYTRFSEALQALKPRITTAGGYGNFTVAHEKLVEQLVSHPDELLNWLNSGRIATQLDSLDHEVDQSLGQRMSDLGYRWGQNKASQFSTPMRSPDQQKASVDASSGSKYREGDTKVIGGQTMVRKNGHWVPQ